MAISIEWPTGVINIPRADMPLVQISPFEIRSLNIDDFHEELRTLETSAPGRPFPLTHDYTGATELSGIQFAPTVRVRDDYYTITFEDGSYAVNIVGGNSNISDVTNLNSVSVRPQNSAGFTQLGELELILQYLRTAIYIDTVNGIAGTVDENGYPNTPVNNLSDAIVIANSDKLTKFVLRSNLTISEPAAGYSFESEGTSRIVTLTGASVLGSTFKNFIVTGIQNGFATYYECTASGLSGFYGQMRSTGLVQSGLGATPSLSLAADQEARLINCFESDPTADAPLVDISAGTTTKLTTQNYSGCIRLTGMNNASKRAEINLNGGQLTLDSSCTDGTICISGVGSDVVLNGATCTVESGKYVSPTLLRAAVEVEDGKVDEIWRFSNLDASKPITGNDSDPNSKTETDGTVTITHTITGDSITSQRSG